MIKNQQKILKLLYNAGSANFGPRAKCGPQSQNLSPRAPFQPKIYIFKAIKIVDFIIKT